MGILANTVSISQFDVVGEEYDSSEIGNRIGACLQEQAFVSIETGSEEQALGWVELDDFTSAEFADNERWRRDNYVVFTLRRDQRRLPSALLKGELAAQQQRFLTANPTFNRVPKQKNEELKELVRQRLLARTLPTPTLYDVMWNLDSGRLTFASVSMRAIDELCDLFQKTFPGLRLVLVHPLQRARALVAAPLRAAWAQLDDGGEAPVLQQIEDGAWLGGEFMLWLMYRTAAGNCTYSRQDGDNVTAWLDNRFLLAGSGNEGAQKVTITGPQDNFAEVCAALRQEKQLLEATIHLEQEENQWRLNLKGELFQFGSFKCPAVRVDRSVAAEDEQVSIFYERAFVLERGLELFDAVLAAFLACRLGADWPDEQQRITQWLEG